MSVTPPTATQCPRISSLDDIVAPYYDVADPAEGPVLTFASDGCVPTRYAAEYLEMQKNLASLTPGTSAYNMQQAAINAAQANFSQYQFRLCLVVRWVKVADIRVPAHTPVPQYYYTVTQGASGTLAYSFGLELGMRVWAEVEGSALIASTKAGMELSAKISAEVGESFTWSNSNSLGIGPSEFTPPQDTRLILWQQYSEVQFQERLPSGSTVTDPDVGTTWTTTDTFVDQTTTAGQDVFPPIPDGELAAVVHTDIGASAA